MGRLRIGRFVQVQATPEIVRDRVLRWAELYGFQPARAETDRLLLRRGSRGRAIFSFDVADVPTSVRVNLEAHHDFTDVTIAIEAKFWGTIFLAGDRKALEGELDVLEETLLARRASDTGNQA